MQGLQLDFAPRSRSATLPAVLLASAIIAALWVAWSYRSAAAQTADLQERIAAIRESSGRAPATAADALVIDAKQVGPEIARANAVIAELALPWDTLFADLEAAANPKVVLTGLQPEAQGRRIRIAGEALAYADVLAYVAQLERSDGLANVFLTGHEVRAAASPSSVGFSLVADWSARP